MSCVNVACPAGDICEAGLAFLPRAAREGHVAAVDAPRCLLALGLLQPLATNPDQLSVVPPSTAAAVALRPHQRAASEATAQMNTLNETFRRVEDVYNAAHQDRVPDVVNLHGLATINRVIDAAVAGCATELMTIQPGGSRPPEILDALMSRSLETIRRGVRQRTIYQHAVRSHRPTLEYAMRVMAAGAEIRTVDRVIDRLIICDRRVSFISADDNAEEAAALEIRNPGVVGFLVKAFEHTWDRAIAVNASYGFRPEDVLTDIELSVARMIVSGSTEDKIARNLGIGRRTVAEYASRLARHLGSRSRAQLGYLIATHGLLEEVDTEPGSASFMS
ncbi:helix-turn-helix transcriptional regulator [Micromonospora sp. NPDC005979]|uniref:helix-turn-helix transcriptional regulator n=1 Tax=Micromonospora sp. NPDC005979 TaxID=3156726 RepID=UPI0033BE9DAF